MEDAAPEASDTGEAGADVDDAPLDPEDWVIERVALNDSAVGRQIQTMFVEHFGAFMREDLRPLLRQVARDGEQPQLLVNGLAELMRAVAESIELPLDHPRSGFPPKIPD